MERRCNALLKKRRFSGFVSRSDAFLFIGSGFGLLELPDEQDRAFYKPNTNFSTVASETSLNGP